MSSCNQELEAILLLGLSLGGLNINVCNLCMNLFKSRNVDKQCFIAFHLL